MQPIIIMSSKYELIKDNVLKLAKNNQKINIKQTAKKFQISKNTVKKYLKMIDNDSQKEYEEYVKKPKFFEIEKHKTIIEEKVKKANNSKSIYDFLYSDFYLKNGILKNICEMPFSQSYLKSYINKNFEKVKKCKSKEIKPRFETLPAKQMQVDWKESFKIKLKSNKVLVFNVLIVRCSFSRKTFFGLAFDKKQETVFQLLIDAFKYFGGVSKEILFDNMKTVVYYPKNQNNKFQYELNLKFEEFAKDVGFKIKICKVQSPQTKGKVESAAKVLDKLKVYDGEVEDVNHLNQIIKIQQEIYNQSNNYTTQSTPNYLFEKYEFKELKKLSNAVDLDRYYLKEGVRRKVINSFFISYKGKQYSSDPKNEDKYLYVVQKDEDIWIMNSNNICIGKHKISNNKINQEISHMQSSLEYVNLSKDLIKLQSEENLKAWSLFSTAKEK